MKTACAIRHVPFEDLGYFAAPLEEAGYAIRYLEAGLDAPGAADNADLLVVLGGPIGVYQTEVYPFLADEIAVVRRRLADGRPTLGLCLGAQIMVAALGGRVFPGGTKEIGWSELTLTDAGRASPLAALDGTPVLHWHGDTYELPDGAVNLASSAVYEQQAFAVGDHGLALQFHPEVTAEGLERWYIGHTVELGVAGVSVIDLRADAARFAAGLADAGRAMLRQWFVNFC